MTARLFLHATLSLCLLALLPQARAANTNRFELLDGDRVVMVGDTLIEQENRFGHLEYMMTIQFPDRNVLFRNLGWSADLPNGISRVSFDWSKAPDTWTQRLIGQIHEANPTVVILGYGMAASFQGDAGLESFRNDMTRLMDAIRDLHPQVRFVLLSPIRHEAMDPPLPNPEAHNTQLESYTAALSGLADRYDAHFVNFYEHMEGQPQQGWRLTDDGIHLNDYGYRRAAEVMAQQYGWLPPNWQVGITEEGKVREGSYGAEVTALETKPDLIRFTAQEELLVPSPWTQSTDVPPLAVQLPWLQLRGLAEGSYDVKVDGRVVETADQSRLGRPGVAVTTGSSFDQAHRLRRAIIAKNELFFHRWRPQNSTYLFLFRKHEQGNNAREIPEFDPLIEAAESAIARLRKPAPRMIEIAPASGNPVVHSRYEESDIPSAADLFDVPPVAAQQLPMFETDAGLEIKLWAQNPLLAKPIQMNFDPEGRLWVASSAIYPQIKPGQEATDTVLVLEDTDHDGMADNSRVFADGLLIPTAVEPGDGGVYVGQSTDLLHFTDTDGDGRADQKRVVLTGFGTEDTHHIIHTLRWGYDGRLYMNQSIYIHTHTETPHGVVRLNSGGMLALNPDTMKLDIFMKGLVNSWGHHFDLYGQSFATDGAGTPEAGLSGVSYVVPGAMYHTYAGARRILGSISPGSYPKFASLEMLHSPHFPDDWQGDLVTCDFRANRVVRFSLEDKDSAYVATEQPMFIRSGNVTFRPIDVKIGPDGALYIADWSNPIIQHGEVDFRDPRRDHVHGRIWRVTYKDRPLDTPPDLARLPYLRLFDELLSANGNTRKQARRVLLERGDRMALPLKVWLKEQQDPRARLEALWLYQGIHQVDPELLGELLQDEDGRIRAAAVRVLGAWHDRIDDPVSLLAAGVADDHPRVRLEALRVLGQMPSATSAALALSVLDKPMDRHLEYGLWLTITELAEPWIASIESGDWKVAGHEAQLMFGLEAIEPALSGRVLAKVLPDQTLPGDGSGPWIELIAKSGGVAELDRVWAQVLRADGFEPQARATAMARLEEAARRRNLMPSLNREAVRDMFQSEPTEVRVQAVKLAGAWKQGGGQVPYLLELVGSPETPPPLRQAALETLRETGGEPAVQGLAALCEPGHDILVRRTAAVALMSMNSDQGAPAALRVLSDIADEEVALAMWRDLLRIRGAARVLTAALPSSGLAAPMAKAGLRAAREGGRQEPELILALSRGANLDSEAVMLTEEELKAWAVRATGQGDPGRGEHVYRRLELACVTCHAIGGVGGKVGPDLTTIGASAPPDYLIESLLYPNRKVKEGYHSVVIETKDDQEFSGILVREATDEWVVRDVLNREVRIAKNNVARQTAGNSLMPSGLMDALSDQEQLDLIRFLSELGKPGAFDATRGNVARRWWLLPNTIDLVQFGEEKVLKDDIRAGDWGAAGTFVDGGLPRSALQEALARKSWRGPRAVYAATQFQTAKAGPVEISLVIPRGTPAWLDGQPMTLDGPVELPAGVHTVLVKLTAEAFPEHLKVSINEGTFLVE